MNTETEKKITFLCACNGCRRDLPIVTRAYHQGEHYLNSVTEGHFFSPDTMRWFRSRISHIALLQEPRGSDQGLAVIVSNKRDSAPREYELVTICKWGYITREHEGYSILHYDTLRQARKALSSAVYPTACACHGCTIDRA
jgi:hypothetical protein